MKKLCVALGVLVLFAFILGGQAAAQVQPVPPPVTGSPLLKGRGGGYNPATVEILDGQVMAVNRSVPKKEGQPVQITLVLKTDRETISVNVGPASYVDQQGITFVAGDVLQVKGSRVDRPRRTVIIAGEIKKGDKVLRLRDASGRPVWRVMRPGR